MVIGIDVGSRFVKLCVLDGAPSPTIAAHEPHGGRPLELLQALWEDLRVPPLEKVGLTGSGAAGLGPLLGLPVTDLCKATIRGVRARVPDARNILDVGASSVTLMELSEAGDEAWEKVKSGFEGAWSSVTDAWKEVSDKFK